MTHATIVFGSSKDIHGPNRLRNYLEIHTTAMARHRRDGFVVSDDLEYFDLGDGFLSIEGYIRCLGSLYVAVDKRLKHSRRGGESWVNTVQYSYNCVIAGVGNLWRYNSPHAHRAIHHVHEYRVMEGDTEGTTIDISPEEWPTLSQVILRFQEWYFANLEELTARGLA